MSCGPESRRGRAGNRGRGHCNWGATILEGARTRPASEGTLAGGRGKRLSVSLSPRDARAALLVAVAYYVGARIGFAFTFQPHPISTLWPPNSLLLAALLLTPARSWWLLLLAAFPAHLAAELQSGVPAAMVLGWFVSNSSEALIGAACIRVLVAGPLRFDSSRDISVFLIFGTFLAPLLSSFLDAALDILIGWGQGSYWQLVRLRFFSNVLAALTLVPVILTWAATGLAGIRNAPLRRYAEAGLLFLGLFTASILIFGWQETGRNSIPALFYAPLPFLLWAAVRLGPVGTSTSLLLMAVIALWGTTHGEGPFLASTAEENARSVQLFVIVACVPLLLLAAAVEERRKAKEALQVSEERFAKAFRSSPDPMAIMRRSDSSIIDVNVRWESMFGYSRAQAVGRTTAELEVYANPRDRQTYDDLAAAQGYVRDFEVDMRDRTGRVHHAVIAAEIVEVGGVPCFIETIRDVTEKKRAEREARDQQKQITHLTRVALIGELSGALAHELNQPLTAILSNAQAAQHYLEKGRIDPKELREILGDIVAQDRRAGEVIRRLRALFKKGETQFQALDANELVREVLELAHSDLITRNIEVVTQASPQLPAMLGDRVEMQQVLLNLIVNACEAMSADGPKEHALTIRTESAADGVQLSIIDRGPGIPADMQERLFEPFFTTKPQGLGLGLSISRSIITAHRGRIWGTNNPDRGATFHIVLPVHAGGTS